MSVSSPQFGWSAEYRVSVEDNVLHLDQVDQAALANRYVQIAALSALSYAYKESRSLFDAALAAGISVVILGDNDFYSQRHAVSSVPLAYPSNTLFARSFRPAPAHRPKRSRVCLPTTASRLTR